MAKSKSRKTRKNNKVSTNKKNSSNKKHSSAKNKQQEERRVPKRSVAAPKSMQEQKQTSADKIDKVVAKKKSVRKSKKRPMERWFWITLFALFIIIASGGVYYVFKDYYKDSSTPAQKAIEDISKEDKAYLESLGDAIELIEDVNVQPQGPIVYMIYTVPAGTPRTDAMNAVNETFTAAIAEKPEMFDVYDFQVTVTNSGDEAEGVNDYPFAGSKNVGSSLVWMDMEGTYTPPVEEPEEVIEGTE